MRSFRLIMAAVTLLLLAGLAGCGGGSGGGTSIASGIGGTGKIASGSITGFGSIFVNGVEYNIDAANCSVDDTDVTGACQANLALGMVVAVEGTVSGSVGTATSVVFDANVEGPVSGLVTSADGFTRTFSVLGTSVTVEKVGTRFDDRVPGFSFSTLAENNVVEVSGFLDAGGTLQATYIEKKADAAAIGSTPVELKGTVADVTGSGGPGDSFTLNGVAVSILPGADLGEVPGGRVANGDFVDARGLLTGTASIDANRIQLEDPRIGSDGDEVSVEGLVSGFNGDPGNFQVAGQTVDASGATFEPADLQLANGARLEVEGVINGTTLVAGSVEARGGEIRIDATIADVTATTLTVALGSGSITVAINSQTTLEDSTDTIEHPRLSDFSAGDFVEIRGFVDTGGVVASEIHRNTADNVVLQGPVDSFVNGSSITVLGVTFFTDGSTGFRDASESSVNAAAFYATLAQGDLVVIRDNQPGDGTADRVAQED
jgi:hypothetical protein